MNRRILLVFVCVATMVACDTAERSVQNPPTASTESLNQRVAGLSNDSRESQEEESQPQTSVQLLSYGEANLLPAPTEPVRQRNRMHVGQLARSIEQVTGGFGWVEKSGWQEVSVFDSLSAALGVPDYLEVTREDLSPSPLFHKFLDDAARDVCTKLANYESENPAETRHLMVFVDPDESAQAAGKRVDDNLRHLILAYHGRFLPEESTELESWRWLFTTVAYATGEPKAAWRSVCVALIRHPDFHSY